MRLDSAARSPSGASRSNTVSGDHAGDRHSGEAVLLVTEDEQLRDEIALITAVVGVRLETAAAWPAADDQRSWAAVMCSAETLPSTTRQAEGVLLLGYRTDALWEAAAQMPGLRPVPLPQAEHWLSEQLTARAFDRSQGKVVAAVSTTGGAGATTFAYLCAAELAARGSRPLLIDAARGPGSGLADLVHQAQRGQQVTGGELDWDQLGRIEGEISTSHLSAAIPELDGIGVLTWAADPGQRATQPQRAALLPAVLVAGRGAFDTVILDVGQRTEVIATVSEQLTKLLLVTRASRRAVEAAHRLLRDSAPVEAVVAINRRAAAGWGPHEVAEQLSAPVAADLAEQKWLTRSDELGEAYELLRSFRGAAMIAALLDALALGDA